MVVSKRFELHPRRKVETVKLICHLREIRGARKLREISQQSGVPMSTLSQLERGQLLARDSILVALEQAYGRPRTDWYAPAVLLAVSSDDSVAA